MAVADNGVAVSTTATAVAANASCSAGQGRASSRFGASLGQGSALGYSAVLQWPMADDVAPGRYRAIRSSAVPLARDT
eukprot:287212-Prymnesium_polylepis.1